MLEKRDKQGPSTSLERVKEALKRDLSKKANLKKIEKEICSILVREKNNKEKLEKLRELYLMVFSGGEENEELKQCLQNFEKEIIKNLFLEVIRRENFSVQITLSLKEAEKYITNQENKEFLSEVSQIYLGVKKRFEEFIDEFRDKLSVILGRVGLLKNEGEKKKESELILNKLEELSQFTKKDLFPDFVELEAKIPDFLSESCVQIVGSQVFFKSMMKKEIPKVRDRINELIIGSNEKDFEMKLQSIEKILLHLGETENNWRYPYIG